MVYTQQKRRNPWRFTGENVAPGQLLGDWEGDLAVVELLGAITLAECSWHCRCLDDAERREAHAMPGSHLLWAKETPERQHIVIYPHGVHATVG